MKPLMLITIPLLLACLHCSASAQSSSATSAKPSSTSSDQFRLFLGDRSCACIKTEKQTKTVTASEIKAGGSIYQVFRSNSDPKKELFRISVGTAGGVNAPKLSNYGIADEADFNSDGLPDYSWYGGDDTGFEMYLFLSTSSGGGYAKVDLVKTIKAAWKQRFHTNPPKFDEADSDYSVEKMLLKRSTSGLVLVAYIGWNGSDTEKKKTYLFEINQRDFSFRKE